MTFPEHVRDFVAERDIPVKAFCMKIERSESWYYKFLGTGKCFDRTVRKMFNEYPDLKLKVLAS